MLIIVAALALLYWHYPVLRMRVIVMHEDFSTNGEFADLHIHSTASDGKFTPREIVGLAKKKGFKAIAIADHDNVGGIEEALLAGKEEGIEVLPAVELSTLYKGGEVHVLGYCFDWRSPGFQKEMQKIIRARIDRGRQMVKKLQALGVAVTWEEVIKKAGSDFVGRPHIAAVLLEKGYIKDFSEAFSDRYIGNNGRAYVERYEMSPVEAVDLIRQYKGIPVLAHPGFFKKNSRLTREDIKYLVDDGLQGIEVLHTKHSADDVEFYKSIAKELSLLITGGSDCHGGNTDEILLGQVRLPYMYVEKLKQFSRCLRDKEA